MGLRLIYGRAGTGKSEKCYKEILNLTHNGESQRGYTDLQIHGLKSI